MKVIIEDRKFLYHILHFSFNKLKVQPNIIELGVLNGVNAKMLQNILRPSHIVLLDSWSCDVFNDYRTTNAQRSWVAQIDTFS